ncbi:hypothetical protein Sliba_29640 [Streptomyces nigrescens]|uniref:Uncharacterized protein n=1 Tax=Streptomyces nigrescens TaxID=1920 RepID=A0A640TJ31_STRNI|nr:hypothetical protein Sliba_29640 [Streptomyces libani subsp. libani]GGV91095.1 hypothetical protein GCM10010500_20440 [Streptomyces libani subsp. libani]
MQLELGDEQDDDGYAGQDGDAQLRVTGRGDRLGRVRCEHLDAEMCHGDSLGWTEGEGVLRYLWGEFGW